MYKKPVELPKAKQITHKHVVLGCWTLIGFELKTDCRSIMLNLFALNA